MEVIEHAISLLLLLTGILAVGVAAMKLAEKIKIPDVVVLLIVGVIIGPILKLIDIPGDSTLNQIILLGGAAYILFHGGNDVDIKVISKSWKSILLLATVGVLISAAVTGYVVSEVLGISFLLAFLLAAVIAPTDPATLIPIFDKIKIRPKVAQTVISESTFNDATGASLVFVLIPLVLGTATFSLAGSLTSFGEEAGIGLLVGLVFGFIFTALVSDRVKIFKNYASKLSIVAAILAFAIADKLGGSGFMAAFIAGLVVGNARYSHFEIKESVHHKLHNFMGSNAAIMRIFIFILLGSHVNIPMVKEYFWEGLIIVVAFMFVARPLTVFLSTLPDRKAKWTLKELIFLCWTREVGVIPAALSGVLIAMEVPQADVIASIVFVAVIVTIILQASTTELLAKKLDLIERT